MSSQPVNLPGAQLLMKPLKERQFTFSVSLSLHLPMNLMLGVTLKVWAGGLASLPVGEKKYSESFNTIETRIIIILWNKYENTFV